MNNQSKIVEVDKLAWHVLKCGTTFSLFFKYAITMHGPILSHLSNLYQFIWIIPWPLFSSLLSQIIPKDPPSTMHKHNHKAKAHPLYSQSNNNIILTLFLSSFSFQIILPYTNLHFQTYIFFIYSQLF